MRRLQTWFGIGLFCAATAVAARAEVKLTQIAPHPGVSYGALLAGENLLVTEGGYSKIQIIPVAHPEKRRELATGKYPFQFLAVDGSILVANTQDEQLTVLNSKLTIQRQIKVPLGVAGMTARAHDVLAVLATDNAFLPLSRPNFKPRAQVDAGHGPWRLAATADRIAIINHRNIMDPTFDAILILDGTSFKQLKLIPTGGGLRDIAAGPDGLFYVTQKLTGQTLVVDPHKLEIVKSIHTGENPGGVTFLKNLGLVVSQMDHSLTAFDLGTGKAVTVDLNRFGSPIKNPLTVEPAADGTLYIVSEGAVSSLTGFLTAGAGGNFTVSSALTGSAAAVTGVQTQRVRELVTSDGGAFGALGAALLSDVVR